MNRNTNYVSLPCAKSTESPNISECVHRSNDKCSILNVAECLGNGCSFLQSEEQRRKENDKWICRMNELSADNQRKIATLYFCGKMPWNEQMQKRRKKSTTKTTGGECNV